MNYSKTVNTMQNEDASVSTDRIPDELKKLKNWVLWREEKRPGAGPDADHKTEKKPLRPNRKLASTTDPSTWYLFDDILDAFRRDQTMHGIGFVFTDTPYAGIDVDNCVNNEGELNEFAREIVSDLDSYTEYSPSGTGIHVIVRGDLGGRRGRNDQEIGLEIYDTSRYFTVTGNRVSGTPDTIRERKSRLENLYDTHFPADDDNGAAKNHPVECSSELSDSDIILRVKKENKNGAALFAGNWEGLYKSPSEADLALCNILAYWCKRNRNQIDRIFRKSGLMRRKWNRDDYRNRTIDKAIANGIQEKGQSTGGGVNAPDTETDADAVPVLQTTDLSECPPLDPDALIDPVPLQDVCPWLARYVEFSRRWSPRGYDGYHTSCGLWLLSTVAARRVGVPYSRRGMYPSLYIVLVGRTTIHAKSTTATIAVDVLRDAGLDWLLVADDSTPEAFIEGLSGGLPADYDDLSLPLQERAKLRIKRPGQRGWFYDEFGQHLYNINRKNGYMAPFRSLLKRFWENDYKYERQTIGRRTTFVRNPYLALLGICTPADLRSFAARGARNWFDGFFARFLFSVPEPDDVSDEMFPDDDRTIPDSLTEPLLKWHERLGLPDVVVDSETDEPVLAYDENFEPAMLEMTDAAHAAHQKYVNAISVLITNMHHAEFHGNYGRLPEMTLRVATLFASLENSHVVGVQHLAAAQDIIERCRRDLHRLAEQVDERPPSERELDENTVYKKIQDLQRKQDKYPTAGDLNRYIRGLSTDEIADIADSLAHHNYVHTVKTQRTTRYYIPGQS